MGSADPPGDTAEAPGDSARSLAVAARERGETAVPWEPAGGSPRGVLIWLATVLSALCGMAPTEELNRWMGAAVAGEPDAECACCGGCWCRLRHGSAADSTLDRETGTSASYRTDTSPAHQGRLGTKRAAFCGGRPTGRRQSSCRPVSGSGRLLVAPASKLRRCKQPCPRTLLNVGAEVHALGGGSCAHLVSRLHSARGKGAVSMGGAQEGEC